MRRTVEVVVPLVNEGGERWHEIRREVEVDVPDGGAAAVPVACALDIHGDVFTSAASVTAHTLRRDPRVELPEITVDPLGDPNEFPIREEIEVFA